MAAAGLWTTPSDLALWIIKMQRSLKGKANHVLSPEMTRLMLTPVKEDYGLGVDVAKQKGEPSFAHSGGNAGYRTFYLEYENGDGAVIMTSGDNGGPLYPDILRSISHVYGWSTWKPTERTAVDVPRSAVSKYTGTFTTQQLGKLEITLEAGHLHASLSYYGSSPLYPLLAQCVLRHRPRSRVALRFSGLRSAQPRPSIHPLHSRQIASLLQSDQDRNGHAPDSGNSDSAGSPSLSEAPVSCANSG